MSLPISDLDAELVSVFTPLGLAVLGMVGAYFVLGRNPRTYGLYCGLGTLATLLGFAGAFRAASSADLSGGSWLVAAVPPAAFILVSAIVQGSLMQSFSRAAMGSREPMPDDLKVPRHVRTGVKLRVGVGWTAETTPAGAVDFALTILAPPLVLAYCVTFMGMVASLGLLAGADSVGAAYPLLVGACGVALVPLLARQRVVVSGVLPYRGTGAVIQVVSPFWPRLVSLSDGLSQPASQFVFRGRRCLVFDEFGPSKKTLIVVTQEMGRDPVTPLCTPLEWRLMIWLGLRYPRSSGRLT